MENIEQRVKKIVAEQLGVNEADVKNESSFVNDLGAEAVGHVLKFDEGPHGQMSASEKAMEKSPSAMMTTKIAWTTASVVFRPTLSADPETFRPW